jgi:hypothetical protein
MERKSSMRLVAPPARNPFVLLAVKGMQRKAGPHRKSEKAMRTAMKVEVKRGLAQHGQSNRLLTGWSSVRF